MDAASALKLTAEDMLENKLIDGVIKEPLGGAHNDPEAMFGVMKKEIKKHLTKLMPMEEQKRVDARIKKFGNMGVLSR